MPPIRVLAVDDFAPARNYVRSLLGVEEDIELVGEATNGLEAIERASALLPDVILMDADMPVLNGIEATKRILEEHPHISVIFFVAEEVWRRQAIEAGARLFLLKDVPPDELLSAIRSYAPVPVAPVPKPSWLDEFREDWVQPRSRAVAKAAGLILAFLGSILIFSLIPFGIIAAYIALTCGFFFFLYAAKYYTSMALILITAGTRRQSNAGNNMGNNLHNGLFGFLRNRRQNNRNGLNFNHNEFRLEREPFVSIHLPMYNESRVVDRVLTACTSLEYNNYEVIVGDDSMDETLEILEEWAQHPKVKVSHRLSRKGFKGMALQRVLEVTDPKAEFIVIFDADFVPPQDVIQQFLFYFYPPNGNGNDELRNDNVAVVQGYQWHMLNADENWLTKGVRTEYSGSYVIERPVEELLGSMKMISGSVYMMRADVLRQLEWGSSITEDWELTLRLYQAGYKVLFTPFIQAPAECVSDFTRLRRQRMRWAEGHTHQVKRHFWRVIFSPLISIREKLEFLYFAPYYLQSAFWVVGTFSWLLSETVFHTYLPFWTSTLGWALVFTNTFALILMNFSGLFMERGVRRDFSGVLSCVALSWLLAPFQAYASVKGLIEREEGAWFRTPKTGSMTIPPTKLGFSRWIRRLFRPRRRREGEHLACGASPPSGGVVKPLVARGDEGEEKRRPT